MSHRPCCTRTSKTPCPLSRRGQCLKDLDQNKDISILTQWLISLNLNIISEVIVLDKLADGPEILWHVLWWESSHQVHACVHDVVGFSSAVHVFKDLKNIYIRKYAK